MKRYLILTSVIALAACGGGGHSGGGTVVDAPRAPTFNSSDLFSNTASNTNVTQMKSQVIVDSRGRVIAPNTRGASIRSGSIHDTDGNTYKVYDLSDVNLHVADSTPASLKIGLTPDGAINEITLDTGSVKSKLARDGNTNTFRGPIFEYVEDALPSITGDPDLSTPELREAYKTSRGFKDGKWVEATPGHGDWYYVQYNDRATFRMVDGTDFGEDLTSIDGFNATLDNGHVTMATLDLIASSKGFEEGHWNLVDERMDVKTNKHISEGDANAVVLQYSDFGHFNPVYRSKHVDLNDTVLDAIREHGAAIEAALLAEDNATFESLKSTAGLNRSGLDKYRDNDEFADELAKEDFQLFAGGYAIGADGNLIEEGTFEAPRNTTFTGKAVGRVYTSIHANNDGTEKEYRAAVLDQYGIAHDSTEESIRDAGHDVAKEFKTSSAQLTVDASGNQRLEMNFPDFYQVVATKPAVGDVNITLTKPDGVTIEKQYMRTADVELPTYTTEAHQVIDSGATVADDPVFLPGYYGVGSASEAAGLVRYAEESSNIQVEPKTADLPSWLRWARGLDRAWRWNF